MEINVGQLYYIKDEFFKRLKQQSLMINNKNGHYRPYYVVVKNDDILLVIPVSSRIEKYQNLLRYKIKKYGKCSGILIKKVGKRDTVFLLQNAFPVLEKYIDKISTEIFKDINIVTSVKKDIFKNLSI